MVRVLKLHCRRLGGREMLYAYCPKHQISEKTQNNSSIKKSSYTGDLFVASEVFGFVCVFRCFDFLVFSGFSGLPICNLGNLSVIPRRVKMHKHLETTLKKRKIPKCCTHLVRQLTEPQDPDYAPASQDHRIGIHQWPEPYC